MKILKVLLVHVVVVITSITTLDGNSDVDIASVANSNNNNKCSNCDNTAQEIEIEIKAKDKVLSRKKRYLVFPTGSSFSVATCSTIGIYGNPQYSIFR
jgi:biopolymer transport protein ExbD